MVSGCKLQIHNRGTEKVGVWCGKAVQIDTIVRQLDIKEGFQGHCNIDNKGIVVVGTK